MDLIMFYSIFFFLMSWAFAVGYRDSRDGLLKILCFFTSVATGIVSLTLLAIVVRCA